MLRAVGTQLGIVPTARNSFYVFFYRRVTPTGFITFDLELFFFLKNFGKLIVIIQSL